MYARGIYTLWEHCVTNHDIEGDLQLIRYHGRGLSSDDDVWCGVVAGRGVAQHGVEL